MQNKPIWIQRYEKVYNILSNYNINSVIEFGSGDGKFLPYLKKIKSINKIGAVDKDKNKINKIKSSYPDIIAYDKSFLEYDNEFHEYECIVAIEVIEHLSKEELSKFLQIIFCKIQPRIIVFTTPNIEYNVNYQELFNGLRHKSHRFELSPSELIELGNNIIHVFKNYKFYTDFCDHNKSSQLIVFLGGMFNGCY